MIQLEILKKQKSDGNAGSNWKKNIKNSLKSDKGLKSVMEILVKAETSNQSFASALSTVALPPIPVTLPIPPPGQITSVKQQLPVLLSVKPYLLLLLNFNLY